MFKTELRGGPNAQLCGTRIKERACHFAHCACATLGPLMEARPKWTIVIVRVRRRRAGLVGTLWGPPGWPLVVQLHPRLRGWHAPAAIVGDIFSPLVVCAQLSPRRRRRPRERSVRKLSIYSFITWPPNEPDSQDTKIKLIHNELTLAPSSNLRPRTWQNIMSSPARIKRKKSRPI